MDPLSPTKTLASLQVHGLAQIEIIGAGGMSKVYRAQQVHLGRPVALKELKPEFLNQPEVVERFRREAKALGSILHQNIAHVYDFIESPQGYFILMEYIDGIDLSQVISKMGALPHEVAVSILLGISRGLAHMHSRNLIHRDLKPSNIRLTPRGEAKLMDFGIVLEVGSSSLTRPGFMVGSPSYLSPEQVLGERVTPSSDLFALGICFYEMLTGTRPFKEEGQTTVFQKIRQADYVSLRRMKSNVPKPVLEIAEKLLKRDPAHRFKNIRELTRALENALGPLKTQRLETTVARYLEDEGILKAELFVHDDPALASPVPAVKGRSAIPIVAWALACVLLGVVAGVWIAQSTNRKSTLYPPPSNLTVPLK